MKPTESKIMVILDDDDPPKVLGSDARQNQPFPNTTMRASLDPWERLTSSLPSSRNPRPLPSSPIASSWEERLPSDKPLRNPPIAPPLVKLESYTHNGVKVNPKTNVELQNGEFMRVHFIVKNTATSETTLRGWVFQRTKEMNGILERKLNEICWILHVDKDDLRDAKIQGMETVPIEQVVRRRHIRLTNQLFPRLSWREDPGESEEIISRERVLVCRSKYICTYLNAGAREANGFHARAIHRLQANECDQSSSPDGVSCTIKHEDLRRIWRGETVKGGACKLALPGEEAFRRQELGHHINLPHAARTAHDSDLEVIDPPSRTVQARQQQRNQLTGRHYLATIPDSRLAIVSLEKASHVGWQGSRHSVIDLTCDASNPGADPMTFEDSYSPRKNASIIKYQRIPTRSASPEVVEIKAEFSTSSRLGTRKRTFEGRLTTTQSSRSRLQSQRKRSRTQQLGEAGAVKVRRSVFDFNSGFLNSTNSEDTVSGSSSPASMKDVRTPLGRAETLKEYDIGTPASLRKVEKAFMRKDPNGSTYVESADVTGDSLRVFSKAASSTSSAAKNRTKSTTGNWNSSSTASRPTATTWPSLSIPRGLHSPQAPVIHHKAPARPPVIDQQRYTLGDCFCGAGGTSRGAVMAGLRVEWGFDFNPAACATYQLNFYGTSVYEIWANDFISLTDGEYKVDILHLSPPCQFFSDAHTIQGKDDDMNTASLFAISELLKKAKPRVVTLEQTSGLIRRHPVYFNAVILMFTSLGFSVRWKLINFADYGLPQRRVRVVIIASCPGEILPDFPEPTHSGDPLRTGLKPWVTFNQAIGDIPTGWSLHDVEHAKKLDAPAESGDTLAKCICTGGSGLIHPSGKRELTLREFASLQGFPLEHKFGTTGVKKQIGNAVPPICAKILLEGVKKALMKADGLT